MKKIKKNYLIPLLLLTVQMIFLVYINLFCIPDTMDNDSAKLFLHAIEMWKNKAVFIPGWVNQTTLEIDCPLFLAVFIYGICGNIYISFAVADFILIALTIYTVYRILSKMKVDIVYILYTIVLLFIPYSFGQLLYINMTFFSGGQYIVKILTSLMLIDLLSDGENRSGSRIARIIAMCFLSFICAISSGEYVFLTGLFPVMAAFLWFAVIKDNKSIKDIINNGHIWLCIVVTVLSGIGVCVSRVMKVGSSTEGTTLIPIANITDSFLISIRSIFELFGSLPYDPISVMSLSGILYTLRTILAISILGFAVSIIVKLIRKIPDPKEEDFIEASLVMVFLINFIILWLTGRSGEPRYYTIVVFMCIMFTGSGIGAVACSVRGLYRSGILRIFTVAFVTVIMLLSDMMVIKGECYPAMLADNIKLGKLIDCLKERQERTVYFLDDTNAAELMRVMDYDSGRVYLAFKSESDNYNKEGVVVNDYYSDITDASRMDQEHLMIVNTYYSDINVLPEYMKDLYTEVDSFQNFVIYESKINRMDGLTGYKLNDHSRDYCYTKEYTIYSGELGQDGTLISEGVGDYVVSSPYLGYYTGGLDIIMDYFGHDKSGNEDIGRLELWDGDTHELIASQEITATDEPREVRMQDIRLDHQNPVLKVFLNEKCDIGIKYFDYVKK